MGPPKNMRSAHKKMATIDSSRWRIAPRANLAGAVRTRRMPRRVSSNEQPLTRSAPNSPDGACTPGAPHYLRIAKTASTSAVDFIRRSNCVQKGYLKRAMEFHGEIPESEMQQGQRTLVVMREPCDRARSTLAWWPRVTLPTHPAHNLSTLHQFATFAAELPWRYPRAWKGTTYQRVIALAWEQSRYINNCTQVLCHGPGLEQAFQQLCQSSLAFPLLNGGDRTASAPVAAQAPLPPTQSSGADECKPIRSLYPRDFELWKTHCRRGEQGWMGG